MAGVNGGIPFVPDSFTSANAVHVTAFTSAGIQEAIDSAKSEGKNWVYLPNGTYDLTAAIKMTTGVSLVGESRSGTELLIKFNSGNAIAMFNDNNCGVYRMTLRGMFPVGDGTYHTTPINKWGCDTCNELPDVTNRSISISQSYNCWVDDVSIYNSGRHPLWISGNAYHNTIRNVRVKGAFNKGGGAMGYFMIGGRDNLVTECSVTEIRHITMQGTGSTFNVLNNNDFDQEISFHVEDSGYNLVEGNRVTLPADMPVGYYAIMGTWSVKHDMSLNDNYVYNNYFKENNHGGDTLFLGQYGANADVFAGPIDGKKEAQAAGRTYDHTQNFEAGYAAPPSGRVYMGTSHLSSLSVQDAYIRRGTYESNNYNTSTLVIKRANDNSYDRETLLLFNVSDISIIPKKVVLKMYLNSFGQQNASTSEIQVFKAGISDWDETTVTGADIDTTGNVISSTTVSSALGLYEWDVTSAVQDVLNNGDTLVSLLLKCATNDANYLSFDSKESDFAPRLDIRQEINPLVSDHDTFVRRGSYSGNNYNSSLLTIKNVTNPSFDRDVVVSFDVSAIVGAPESITLKMHLNTFTIQGSGGSMSEVNVFNTNSHDWDETNVTGNDIDSLGTLVSSTVVNSTTGFYQWDVTSAVLQAIYNGTKVSLLLRTKTADGNYMNFTSRESDYELAPRLVIDQVTPPPSGARVAGAWELHEVFDSSENPFNIYPNPTQDYLNILGIPQGSELSIYNISGLNLIKKTVNRSNNYQFDVSLLKRGLYILTIWESGTNQSRSYKFLKSE
ncbi:DNRLRE domain-containing protein [Fulvivirga sp. M361]|uniref:CBM96 family carbohydrate-binding protein n=1 Tax=Fulvivirga sp. M361 TaxID=2594266 RepID=UPI001623F25D|nr:DNRLRE domain-containing protein [Fulvivirga sp. M361]